MGSLGDVVSSVVVVSVVCSLELDVFSVVVSVVVSDGVFVVSVVIGCASSAWMVEETVIKENSRPKVTQKSNNGK